MGIYLLRYFILIKSFKNIAFYFDYLKRRIEEAIQVAVREKSEYDLLYIQREVGKANKELYDRITNLRAQIQ